eukprot:8818935-Pyramimonas_sp.AAC.1
MKTARSFAQRGQDLSKQEKTTKRDLERAIVEERKLYRSACCPCPECADRRPGCPMRRPSGGPNLRKTPWVWSHGDGRGYCADPHSTWSS